MELSVNTVIYGGLGARAASWLAKWWTYYKVLCSVFSPSLTFFVLDLVAF